MSEGRLAGQVALVTGAGRGIGRALAAGLAAEGAEVVGVSRTLSELELLADEIRAAGGRAHARACDVSDERFVSELAAWVHASFGRLHVLINNAALRMIHVGDPSSYRTDVLDLTIDEWDRMLAVNLRGAFLTAKLLAPSLIAAGRASVINISAGGGNSGMGGRAPYCASKFALEGLTESLAEEWAPLNIAVNALTPGVSILTDSIKLDMRAKNPSLRYVQPEMMVPPAVFLAGQDVRSGGRTGTRVDAFAWVRERGLGGWDAWQVP